ncbi:hypothetical protein JCM10213_002775 [Rhodosporidiobolus nylandii]
MAQASPFLLSLGVSKSMMSVVFLAGPLSGLIVQPLVGVISDGCKSPLGRRRPFIIGGCALTSVAVVMLGWSREIAGVFAEEGGVVHQRLAIACAVISVYIIDFAVNVVQAMDRSLLIDVIPPAQQPAANAWAGRMFGFGAVFGYWIGGLDLVWLSRGWLGNEQLKVLTIFTSFFLITTHAITCASVQERVLISREDEHSGRGPLAALEDIWTTIRTLPRPIQQVFNVQFTGWIGWFPVLFFSTTWVAEIYVRTRWGDASSDLASAPPDVREQATRAGTHAMLWHSVVSLATSILVPPLVEGGGGEKSGNGMGRDRAYRSGGGRWEAVKRYLPDLPFAWLSLPLLWTISNGVFATLLFGTWFATSVGGASFVVAAAGFAWAVTNWAPFALLGDLILRQGSSTPNGLSPNPSSIMLHRTSASAAEVDELYHPNLSLSPIPEEASDDASSSASFRPKPSTSRSHFVDPGSGTSHTRPPGPLNLSPDLSTASFSPVQAGSPAFSLGSADDVPFTPATANSHRSFYFDATSSLPSSRAGSLAGPASAGNLTPTLTASPENPLRRSSPSTSRPRNRHDSISSSASLASSFAYPPNHGSSGLDLLGEPWSANGGGGPAHSGEFFGADPYAYLHHGAAHSGSTIQLARSSPGRGRGTGSPEDEGAVLQIRHSDSFDLSASERASFESRGPSFELPTRNGAARGEQDGPATVRVGGLGFAGEAGQRSTPRITVGGDDEEEAEWEGEEEGDVEGGLSRGNGQQAGGGDQTGVILGCHNIYLVLPQFLVTALSSIIFALFAPHHSVISAGAHHGAGVASPKDSSNSTLPSSSTSGDAGDDEDELRTARLAVRALARVGEAMMRRQDEGETVPGEGGGWDALGLIFRIGGVSACVSTYICFRMWRDRQRAQARALAAGRGYRLG